MRKRREQRVNVAASVLGVLFGAAVMVVLVFGYTPWNGADASTPQEPTPQDQMGQGAGDAEHEVAGANIFDL